MRDASTRSAFVKISASRYAPFRGTCAARDLIGNAGWSSAQSFEDIAAGDAADELAMLIAEPRDTLGCE
jgi:hypothetical protein